MTAGYISTIGLRMVFRSAGRETVAIDGADLRIGRGEFVAITGHSGSGKTTLLSVLGGLLRPTSGSVLVDGEDIYRYGPGALARFRAQKAGFVFQSASLLPSLTVMDNLLLPSLYAPGVSGAERPEERARSCLSSVGLLEKADSFPAHLSGGEARRVALVRSLMNGPEILFADEPTVDLDESTEQQVLDLLEGFHRETGTTLLLVTHSPEIAARAGRRIQMSRGRILSAPG